MTSGTGRTLAVALLVRSLLWVWSAARQSFALPSLGEQSPQPCPSVPGKAGGAWHEQRLPVLPLPCKLPAVSSPLPSSPHPFPLCHCPLEVTATAHPAGTPLGHTRHGWGILWAALEKRHPTEPGVRYSSCQGLSLTHLTLFLLCPHQQDLPQAWGGGTPGGCRVSQVLLQQGCPQSSCLQSGSGTSGQGTARTIPGPRCWSRTKPLGTAPPFPALLAEASSCG